LALLSAPVSASDQWLALTVGTGVGVWGRDGVAVGIGDGVGVGVGTGGSSGGVNPV
jgi:hypothetical protein